VLNTRSVATAKLKVTQINMTKTDIFSINNQRILIIFGTAGKSLWARAIR